MEEEKNECWINSRRSYINLERKPHEAMLIGNIKKLAPGAKVIMYSCGSIVAVIKDRAEMGLYVLNSMQPFAKNMNAENLKEQFGDIMSFHGGIDVQQILPYGTPADIRKEVKRLIKTWMPTGGWIGAASHSIQPDVLPENIVAMFDALQEFGDGKFISEV